MILMRHGQSHFNVVYGETRQDPGLRDPGLTELGRNQAEVAAEHLRQREVHHILASPYTRTLETADIVSRVLGVALTIDPTVGERAVFTCDIGTPRSHLADQWPTLALDHLAEQWWPNLEESEHALDQRCRAFRTQMTDSAEWRGVLVVTHWGVIRSLTGHRVQNADLVLFDPTAPHPGGGTVVRPPDPC